MTLFISIFNLFFISTIILMVSWFALCDVLIIEHVEDEGNLCTYFDGARRSKPESSLVNCTWYSSNACCKRTEVTSVFSTMYPLYGATKECSNQINYLMCYFCSPDQHRWYYKKAHICEDYCNSLYEHCRTAQYNGSAIGENYQSGVEFCEGQRFEVVQGNDHCFKFDPTVFSSANHDHHYLKLLHVVLLFLGTLSLCS